MHSWSCDPLMRRQPIDIYLNALAIGDIFKIQIKSIIFINYKYNGEEFSSFSCYGTLPS